MISRKHAREYCSEDPSRIENYEQAVADKEHMWDCHHMAEILPCGVYSPEDLKKFGLYWKRPASELIYLRHDEHIALHVRNLSPETRRRMSLAHMGKHHSPSTILKRSASLKERYKTQVRAGSKRVVMERLDGTLTIEFASPRRAVEWLMENGYPKASKGTIKACACGLVKRCYNATWRYV